MVSGSLLRQANCDLSDFPQLSGSAVSCVICFSSVSKPIIKELKLVAYGRLARFRLLPSCETKKLGGVAKSDWFLVNQILTVNLSAGDFSLF